MIQEYNSVSQSNRLQWPIDSFVRSFIQRTYLVLFQDNLLRHLERQQMLRALESLLAQKNWRLNNAIKCNRMTIMQSYTINRICLDFSLSITILTYTQNRLNHKPLLFFVYVMYAWWNTPVYWAEIQLAILSTFYGSQLIYEHIRCIIFYVYFELGFWEYWPYFPDPNIPIY